eukprot:CAMPEP_0203821834 /NCGR_PEP_ID=MMETSP0115-20131106/44418_1 /ASSEMBLY_ACC=CAM_ASM_000227 /TAXON_ID=33651 /ORGANISM="Bicosoecid sp, Strain ms1" /LENGTH=78 /DNA_ID=CAMNT_0050730861 /DNA_START=1 /DNA_END=234 /DNA_ORIENTATION=-
MWAARRRTRGVLRGVVTRHWDEGSGAEYYYWSNTGESKWYKPSLLGPEELPWDGYEDTAGGEYAGAEGEAAAGGAGGG